MKVYIVVELPKDNVPKIIGVWEKESDAYTEGLKGSHEWRNVIPAEVKR